MQTMILTPAASTSAARCNDGDFGTSRWQLYGKATSASPAGGRGRRRRFVQCMSLFLARPRRPGCPLRRSRSGVKLPTFAQP